MAGQQNGVFEFIQISCPQDIAAQKRRVRSHAARNPVARRKRVLDHQRAQSAPREDDTTSASYQVPPLKCCALDAHVPDPTTLLSPARMDPFQTFIRDLSDFEQSLFHHYLNHVMLGCIDDAVHYSKEEMEFRRTLSKVMVRAANTDLGLLETIFLGACRHLSCCGVSGNYEAIALRYKGRCIAHLQNAIHGSDGVLKEEAICTTMTLASDASLMGDEDGTRQHLYAAARMINLRGGLQTVDHSGFLGGLLLWFTQDPMQRGTACITSLSSIVAGFVQWGSTMWRIKVTRDDPRLDYQLGR